jgi:hypothetical protein
MFVILYNEYLSNRNIFLVKPFEMECENYVIVLLKRFACYSCKPLEINLET